MATKSLSLMVVLILSRGRLKRVAIVRREREIRFGIRREFSLVCFVGIGVTGFFSCHVSGC